MAVMTSAMTLAGNLVARGARGSTSPKLRAVYGLSDEVDSFLKMQIRERRFWWCRRQQDRSYPSGACSAWNYLPKLSLAHGWSDVDVSSGYVLSDWKSTRWYILCPNRRSEVTDPMMAVVLAAKEELLAMEIQHWGPLMAAEQSGEGTERVY